MDAEKTIIVVLFIISGALLALIAVPMIQGKVTPNWWYGVRTRKTVNNPQVWYEINVYGGKWLFAAGVLSVIVSIGAALIPGWSVEEYTAVISTVLLAIVGIGVIMTLHKLRSL